MKPLITHAELLEYCFYDQRSGCFFKTGHIKGRVGYYDKTHKQRVLCINGKKYRETRLAVFYVTGQWPVGRVKNTSSRRSYNTKFRDLVFELPNVFCQAAIIKNDIKYGSMLGSTKQPTLFQRFINMFPRL